MHIWLHCGHLIAPVNEITISEIILKSNHSRKLSFDKTIIGSILSSAQSLAHNDDVGRTINPQTWYSKMDFIKCWMDCSRL